ncbi:MAG: hypothetical protein WC799_06410 [Desulfobacteraceae bacterium]
MVTHKPALELIEDAVDLLRSDPLHFLLPYYMGSLPFYLAVLFFVTDMRSSFAEQHLVPAALGLAALFILMKLFQSLFALRVYDRMAHTRKSVFTLNSLSRNLAFQAGIHASAFIIMPMALLATLPYVYMVAFYQNAHALIPEDGQPLGTIIGRLWTVAAHAPRQNHVIYVIFIAVRLGVLTNISVLIYTVPQLLKSFFGIESVFTLGGFSPMNSTYIVTVLVLTMLVTDPLFKAVHALRCFYGEAEKTGDDLKAELISLRKNATTLSLMVIFAVTIFALCPAVSDADSAKVKTSPTVTSGVSPTVLEKSIDHVISRREFAWRMPRDKEKIKKEDGLMDDVIAWLKPYVKKVTDTLAHWFDVIAEWLKKIMPEQKTPADIKEKESKPLARYLLYGLIGFAIVLFVLFIVRTVLTGRREALESGSSTTPSPDLSDETTKADDLPPSAWRQLSQKLMDQGEYRLALRALYFETLSCLAESGLLSIASYKSNREYQNELAMKAHEKKELIDLFRQSVLKVEYVWYGNATIEREDVMDFGACQERIMAHAV